MDEDLSTAAHRELKEETGLQLAILEQLYTFGQPGRDPRGRTISVVYWGIVRVDQNQPKAADDAKDTSWFSLNNLPDLAFDHQVIVGKAVAHLKTMMSYLPDRLQSWTQDFTQEEFNHFQKKIREL